MPLLTQCPDCQTKYRVPDNSEGKAVACKKCGTKFIIDANAVNASQPAAAPPAAAPVKKPAPPAPERRETKQNSRQSRHGSGSKRGSSPKSKYVGSARAGLLAGFLGVILPALIPITFFFQVDSPSKRQGNDPRFEPRKDSTTTTSDALSPKALFYRSWDALKTGKSDDVKFLLKYSVDRSQAGKVVVIAKFPSRGTVNGKPIQFDDRFEMDPAEADEISDHLLQMLRDPTRRDNAARFLQDWATSKNIPAMLEMLQKIDAATTLGSGNVNPFDGTLRLSLIAALGHTGDPSVIRPLFDHYVRVPNDRHAVVNALRPMRTDVEQQVQEEITKKPDVRLRVAGNQLLGEIRLPPRK